MKLHEQLCGLALAVNFVGDHWTLLLVRELLPGPRRFSDLIESLTMASNLLTSRLKQLTLRGIVQSTTLAGTPVTAYALTERGEALKEVVDSLIRWSFPEVVGHLAAGYREEARWLMVSLPALASSRSWEGPSIKVRIEVPGFLFGMFFAVGRKPTAILNIDSPDVVVRGTYQSLLGLFSGYLAQGAPAEFFPSVEGPEEHRLALVRFLNTPEH